jgi:phosphoenolpyruvate carboxykinase (ATP)
LREFSERDFVILNAGRFQANRITTGVDSKTAVELSLERDEMIILGTEYAGEMKKGILTIVNYGGPAAGVLTTHCSTTEGEGATRRCCSSSRAPARPHCPPFPSAA